MNAVAPLLAAAVEAGRSLSDGAARAAFAARRTAHFPQLALFVHPDLPADLAATIWDETGARLSLRDSSDVAHQWRVARQLRPEAGPAGQPAEHWLGLRKREALAVAALLRRRPDLMAVANVLATSPDVLVAASAALSASPAAAVTALRHVHDQAAAGGGQVRSVSESSHLGRALALLGAADLPVRRLAAQTWSAPVALAALETQGLPADLVAKAARGGVLVELRANRFGHEAGARVGRRMVQALKAGVDDELAADLHSAWMAASHIRFLLEQRDVEAAFSPYGLSVLPAAVFGSTAAANFGNASTLSTAHRLALFDQLEAQNAPLAAWEVMDAGARAPGNTATWADLATAAAAATT